jgi:eukaryotic-like serine/threonine-protein kinase
MGEVWRARDTRLGREVALKLLPADFAADPERAARFEREAKVLASLNHPNIAVLYGLERIDGQVALAMELVDGAGLDELISRGPIAIEEAIAIATQIAEGVEAAHEKGIVHRDLKPANVKVRADGTVKVLDFGLAKAWEEPAAPGDLAYSPTLTGHHTQAGVILGTAAYMSPEQARGKPVDRRADIWSFGVVLFEMLTGSRLFDGETVSDVLAGVLTKEPNWAALPAGTPPSVARLLRRCLERDPRQRLRDIGEARVALGVAQRGERASAGPARARRGLRLLALAASGAVLLLAGLVFVAGRRWPAAPAVPDAATILDLDLPPGVDVSDYPSGSFSPDGRQFAFVGADKNGWALWLRSLGSGVSRRLPGTDDAEWTQRPIWSPDGRYLLFLCLAENQIKRIDLTTGAVDPLWRCPDAIASRFFSGDWNANGEILFSCTDLFRMKKTGATPEVLAKLSGEEGTILADRWFPDGRHYTFFVTNRTTAGSGVYCSGSVGSAERERLLTCDSPASYSEPGFLFFQRDGGLWAQRLDPVQRRLTGDAVRLMDGVQSPLWSGPGQWVSKTNLAVLAGKRRASQLVWFDRGGRERGRAGDPLEIVTFDLSSNGMRVAASIRGFGGTRIGLIDATQPSSPVDMLTKGPVDYDARFNRDATELIFTSEQKEGQGIFRYALKSRSSRPLLVLTADEEGRSDRIFCKDWSRDGRFLIIGSDATGRLRVEPTQAPGTGTGFVIWDRGYPNQGRFSPDGRWVAFNALEANRDQVLVSAVPPHGDPVRVSPRGGVQPIWRADGRELYYLEPSGSLVSVDVTATTSTFAASPPRYLFDTGVRTPNRELENYAVTGDGQRFLIKQPVESGDRIRYSVVLDWPVLLSKKEGEGR